MSRNSERAANYRKNRLSNLDKNEFAFKLALSYMLGMSIDELEEFVNNSISKPGSYVLLEKEQYDKMMSSLSASFKAGEDKERDRHIKDEDAAFERGKKYGAEQKENELRRNYDLVPKKIVIHNDKYADEPDWIKKERERYADPIDWYEKEQEKYRFSNDLNKKNKSILDDFVNFMCGEDSLFETPESGNLANLMISRMHDLLKENQQKKDQFNKKYHKNDFDF